MKRFKTLLWLEYRRSRVWAGALLGSLVFWWWGLLQVRLLNMAENTGVRAGLLTMAASIGLLVLCLMIGRIRSETRQGQYQVLLLSPPSGYMHILARFTFTAAVAALYTIAIGGLFWWTFAQAQIPLTAADIVQITLGLPLYALATIMIPAMAWTLLLMVYISAYRVSGPGWIPGTVMILTTPFLGHWLGRLFVRVSYSLPGWHVLTDMQRVLDALGNTTTATFEAEGIAESAAIIPQEPVWIMLGLTALMLVLAGRIWQEVEG